MCVYFLRLLSIFLTSLCFKFQSPHCFWFPKISKSGFQVWSLTRYNTSQNFLLKKFLKENSVSRNLSTRILRRTGKLGGKAAAGGVNQKSLYISLHLSNQKDIIDIIKPCSGLNSKNICCYVNIIPYDSFFVKSRSSTDRDGNFHPPTLIQLMQPSQPHTGPAGTWIMCWNYGIRKRIIQRFTTYNCLVDLYIGNFNVRSTPKF